MKKLILFAFTAFLCSCTNESELEKNSTSQNQVSTSNPVKGDANLVTTSTNGNITAVIYPYTLCSDGGYVYAIYATASEIVNFERQVTVVAFRNSNNTIMESFILKIPANKSTSVSLRAFSGETVTMGSTTVTPTKVFVNNQNVSSQYELISSNEDVDNCYVTSPTNPCALDHDGDGYNNCVDEFPLDGSKH